MIQLITPNTHPPSALVSPQISHSNSDILRLKQTMPCSRSSLNPLTSKYSDVFSCSISHCLNACANSFLASANVGRCRGSLCHVLAISLYSSGRQLGGISGRTPLGILRTTSRPDKFGYGVQPAKETKCRVNAVQLGTRQHSRTHLVLLSPTTQSRKPTHQSLWKICDAAEPPGPSIESAELAGLTLHPRPLHCRCGISRLVAPAHYTAYARRSRSPTTYCSRSCCGASTLHDPLSW